MLSENSHFLWSLDQQRPQDLVLADPTLSILVFATSGERLKGGQHLCPAFA